MGSHRYVIIPSNCAQLTVKDELVREKEFSRVNSADLSQPMCTAIQIALVEILSFCGIIPAAVTGHSSGEIAAAYAAGILSQKDALKIAYHRGLAVHSLKTHSHIKGGAMLAVGLSAAEVEILLFDLKRGEASIACFNSPLSVTVAGDEEAISELEDLLKQTTAFSRRLMVDVAYHSHHMQPVAEQYGLDLQPIDPQTTQAVAFYSSVTGTPVKGADLGPEYWVENMLRPVRFSDVFQKFCLGSGCTEECNGKNPSVELNTIVEIGPHAALAGPIKQIISSSPKLATSSIAYFPTLVRSRSAVETIQELVGRLFERSCSVDLSVVNVPHMIRSPNLLIDLPPYPFNHSTSYWSESKESRKHRLRSHPRTDLLGVAARQSHSLEPLWRNLIRPAEIPWIRDHQVDGNTVYPGAGFLVMAIEAVAQRASDHGASIKAFELREISIGSALVIPDSSDEVEVLFSLRPYNESTRSSSDIWEEFRIFSIADDETSIEHCRGLISTEKSDARKNSDPNLAHRQRYLAEKVKSEQLCSTSEVVPRLYEKFRRIGLNYGPLFSQRLTEARHGSGRAMAKISVADTASIMPSNFEYPYVLHPSTLDSTFHVVLLALMSQHGNLKHPYLPTFIRRIYVSHEMSRKLGQTLDVHAWNDGRASRETACSLMAFETTTSGQSPVLVVDGMVMKSLTSFGGGNTPFGRRRICYQTHWDIDVDLLPAALAIPVCDPNEPPIGEFEHVQTLDQAAFYYVQRTLLQVSEKDTQSMLPHNQCLYHFMREFQQSVLGGALDYDTASWISALDWEKERVLERVKNSGDEGALLSHVGESLRQILLGEVEPLSVMMDGLRLEKYYRNHQRISRQYEQAARYIGLLAHKNPHLKVLEIGAGTGGATLSILRVLGGFDSVPPRFSSYTYTDISAGFFEKAKEKFSAWSELLSFKKLDIESDPSIQGFEHGSFDLVIAVNVLHATRSMDRTMKHVRQLLKPKGTLVLTEVTRKKPSTTMIFGTLPGWWMGRRCQSNIP